ncbi:class I SAM-dependent methyltransferase [Pseudorhodoferax sp.]|uniref:class I SAM-dependent methyltransferase n=1 Tax=Pseudorhodoferax sp. TaxID=1993553 RepID=UPI0039E240A7
MPQLPALVTNELDVLASLVPLAQARIVEAGCGAAQLARALLARYPEARVTGLEVDERQLAKNLAAPATPGLQFLHGGAQAMPLPDAAFDGALMLKSLHHVPVPLMDQALAEMARVLRPGGWLYVSEPVYAGPYNELVRLYNEEGEVRAQAQRALDRAVATGRWRQAAEHRFDMPVGFASFAEFEQRQMRATYADHRIDDALLARVRAHYARHADATGAVAFERPVHVRLLRLDR